MPTTNARDNLVKELTEVLTRMTLKWVDTLPYYPPLEDFELLTRATMALDDAKAYIKLIT